MLVKINTDRMEQQTWRACPIWPVQKNFPRACTLHRTRVSIPCSSRRLRSDFQSGVFPCSSEAGFSCSATEGS